MCLLRSCAESVTLGLCQGIYNSRDRTKRLVVLHRESKFILMAA